MACQTGAAIQRTVRRRPRRGPALARPGNGEAPDLVVVDGIESCLRIRSSWDVPIIVVSVQSEEPSKVKALDSGADDYLVQGAAL